MRITRHQPDLENLKRIFQLYNERLDSTLEAARRQANNLYMLLLDGLNMAFAGSVVAPDTLEVARGLHLAAQAGAAIFATARPQQLPASCSLGEGPAAIYTQPTDESFVNLFDWMKAYHLGVIMREKNLLPTLCAVPYQLLMQSSTRGGDELAYRFIDLLKAVLCEPHFTRHPVFLEYEAFCTSGPSGAAPNEYVKRMTVPLLRVLKQLERKDDSAFNNALSVALEGHKEHWSSTALLRKLFDGLVSLPLIAIAALAHDRGMKVDVDSDYLPMSWVTGSVFAEDKPSIITS